VVSAAPAHNRPPLATILTGPDLNPIEHVWAMMAKEWWTLRERTVPALERHVRDIWRTLEQRHQIIGQIVRSMPQRLQAVIDAGGGATQSIKCV